MKKRIYKLIVIMFLCCAIIVTLIPNCFAETKEKELRILFTHDLHSSIYPYNQLNESGDVVSVGGFARLKTAIDSQRTDSSILVDAGDFSMGTFFNSLYQTESAELTLMGEMGYDATTLGNHEFDYYVDGLVNSLNAASGEHLPTLLTSNLDLGEDAKSKEIKAALEKYGSKETMIIEREGITIGLFGMIGEQAQSYTNTTDPVTFADTVETAKKCVEELHAQGADIIVCLSHGGTSKEEESSEDEQLAKDVQGIDVIISGHSHTVLNKPIQVGDTLIVSAGSNANYLGVLDVTIKDSTVIMADYNLVAINETLEENQDINTKIQQFRDDVDKYYLSKLGLNFNQVMGSCNHNFTDLDTVLDQYGEYDITNLITDAYLNEVPKEDEYTTVSVICSGLIRNSLLKGNITASDVYNILSLGMGEDGSLGYPLAQFYITGKELKALCEVDVSVFPIMKEAQLFFTGVRYTYNTNRLLFNKVIDVETQNQDGSWEKLDDNKTYRVVCSLYMAQMAGLITDTTHGILEITPKTKDGKALTDLNDAILHKDNGEEIKEWIALSNYISSFPKNEEGISQISDEYSQTRDDKISVKTSLKTLFEHPSKFTLIVYAVIIVLLAIIVSIVVLIVKKRKKKRRR